MLLISKIFTMCLTHYHNIKINYNIKTGDQFL